MVERPTVILVRHGHTPYNSTDQNERIRGHLDIPLSAKGRQEARELAADLKDVPIRMVGTSDLSRAAYTAQQIARANPKKPQVIATKALRPWNLGDYQGQPVHEVKGHVEKLVAKQHTPAPNGETFNEFQNRFLTFLSTVLDDVKKAPEKGVPVLVTHTRNLRLAEAWLEAGEKGFTPEHIVGKSTALGTGEGMKLEWVGHKWTMSVLDGKEAAVA